MDPTSQGSSRRPLQGHANISGQSRKPPRSLTQFLGVIQRRFKGTALAAASVPKPWVMGRGLALVRKGFSQQTKGQQRSKEGAQAASSEWRGDNGRSASREHGSSPDTAHTRAALERSTSFLLYPKVLYFNHIEEMCSGFHAPAV